MEHKFDWKKYLIYNRESIDASINSEKLVIDHYKNIGLRKGFASTFSNSNLKCKNYVVTILGYTTINENGDRHTNWFPWNRFCDVFKTLGYKTEWCELSDIKNFHINRIYIVWNNPTSLELYKSGIVKATDIVFQKLTSLGKGMENVNWTSTPHNWCENWNWPIYQTLEYLCDQGLNVYGFGCKSKYSQFKEKKRIVEKLKNRIFWISWGGTPFDYEQIITAKPIITNLTEEINFVGSKWGKIGRGNIDAWEKYIEPLEKKFNFSNKGGIGNKMLSDNDMVKLLKKSKLCPIVHAPSWQAERGIQDRFYTVFISGRFGICDNFGAIDIFGEFIKDICAENKQDYFEKSVYYHQNVNFQIKYIEYIQSLIKKKYNFYTQWYNIFTNISCINVQTEKFNFAIKKIKLTDAPFINKQLK